MPPTGYRTLLAKSLGFTARWKSGLRCSQAGTIFRAFERRVTVHDPLLRPASRGVLPPVAIRAFTLGGNVYEGISLEAASFLGKGFVGGASSNFRGWMFRLPLLAVGRGKRRASGISTRSPPSLSVCVADTWHPPGRLPLTDSHATRQTTVRQSGLKIYFWRANRFE
jgi:hypothetical protein